MTMKPLKGQALIDQWIAPLPRGAAPLTAKLKGRGIEAWVIVEQWQRSGHDPAGVADAFNLPLAAVEATLLYYRKHKDLFDAHIRAQQSGD
jgi:uncharacterized protein (DUF433 family)